MDKQYCLKLLSTISFSASNSNHNNNKDNNQNHNNNIHIINNNNNNKYDHNKTYAHTIKTHTNEIYFIMSSRSILIVYQNNPPRQHLIGSE
jgi:hypothetical protein